MKIILFRNTGRFRRNGLALLATLLLSTALFTTLAGLANPQAPQQAGTTGAEITDPQLDQAMLSANVQHEIVKGLVEQGHFDQVLPEMRKLFALNLPDSEEHRIAESAAIIAKLLVDRRQFALAHQVLDEAFTRMNRNADKANVLKIKAKVFAVEGKLDQAVETYKRALELEKIK
jgi:tetratricopeptide (TPR) repeat protein